jgi:exosome complex component RRP42
VYVLDHDGNLIDASGMAALGALLDAKMHAFEVEDGEVKYKDKIIPLPMLNYPVPITSAKINGSIVIDPCLEEEQVMSCRLTVTTDKDSQISAMQKGGLGVLTPDEVKQIVTTAITKSKGLRETILSKVNQ